MSETVFTLITTYSVYVILRFGVSVLPAAAFADLFDDACGRGLRGRPEIWCYGKSSLLPMAVRSLVDQIGYLIGRHGGAPLLEKVARSPTRAVPLRRARALVDRYGAFGVFFSKSLTAPLGPWVNLIAGATGLSWRRFAIFGSVG